MNKFISAASKFDGKENDSKVNFGLLFGFGELGNFAIGQVSIYVKLNSRHPLD
jgi:hypothetical protein